MTCTRLSSGVRHDVGPRSAGLLLAAVAALVALGVALLAGGGAPQPLGDLPGADRGTRWLVPLAGLGARLCSVGAVGVLLVAVLLPPGELRAVATAASGRWAAGWAALAALAALATAAERAGDPLGSFVLRGDLVEGLSSRAVAGLLASGAVALVLASPWRPERVPHALVLGLVGLLPPVLAGHAAAGPAPLVGATALGAHVVAASLWVGGLLALVRYVGRSDDGLATAVPRYSCWALGCFAVLVVSGGTVAALALSAHPGAWSSGWGWVLTAKVLALLGLGLAGHRHRRHTLPQLLERRPEAFVRLACAEVALMAAALGLAAALARTPTG